MPFIRMEKVYSINRNFKFFIIQVNIYKYRIYTTKSIINSDLSKFGE